MSATDIAPAQPAVEQPEGKKGGKKKKKILLIVVALVVLGGGYMGAKMTVLKPAEAAEEEAPPEPVEGEIVEVAQMTVNLAGGQAMHYARVTFATVLVEGADAAAVEAKFPILKDTALSEIGRFSADQLRTPEGVDALRAKLTERARAVYPDGEVMRVVLTELIVQ